MTEQEVILKIKSLKQIKPRENWVVFAKSQILNNNHREQPIAKASYAGFFPGIFRIAFLKKIAYSMAVVLFVVMVGAVVAILPNGLNGNISKTSPASLIAIKDNVEEFKTKSKVLSSLVGNNPQELSLAVKEVEDVAKKLTDAIGKNPELAKEVALDINNNKTYLEIAGTDDLKETSDTLCKAVVGPMIEDTKKLIEDMGKDLAESYKNSLHNIESLDEQGNCSDALEGVLLLYIAISQGNI